ncbi:MAG: phosphatase PAP2 family protein [Clostridia bacterium]|nr:phosphatase PAP2 family protein [Clostridia bacterium]
MEFLRFLEGIRNPVFDFILSLITHLGEETIFMAVAIMIFWCFSKKDGYYLLSVGFVGTVLNQFLKLAFRIPRPWVEDPSFTIVESARAEATGYSFPSGHTQSAVGNFGGLAYTYKSKKSIWIPCVVACVLVAFSRMYLGVHFPTDVLVSVGIAIVLIFALKPVMNKAYDNPKIMYITLSTMALMSLALILYVEFFNFPADIDKHNIESGIKNAYTLFGATLGMILAFFLEKKYVNFETEAKWYTQIIKLAVGLGLILGIKAGLKPLLNFICMSHPIAHSVRYAIIVLFAAVVWPLTFPLIRKIENLKKSEK